MNKTKHHPIKAHSVLEETETVNGDRHDGIRKKHS